MKKLLPIAILSLVLGCLASCNEKPRSYVIVTNMTDGQQKTEQLTAKNDTDALNQYLERMSAVIVENIGKEVSPIKDMFVISPDGDTLNTNEELLEHVVKQEQAAVKQDTVLLGTVPAAK